MKSFEFEMSTEHPSTDVKQSFGYASLQYGKEDSHEKFQYEALLVSKDKKNMDTDKSMVITRGKMGC